MDKFVSKRKEIECEAEPAHNENKTTKKRRLQHYRPIWEKEFPELRPVVGNTLKARCSLCVGRVGADGFSISHGGITDVRQHFKSALHKERQIAARQATILKSFSQINSPESQKTTAAELSLVYHAVKHHQSYVSTECNIKLLSQLFTDSAASKLSCGKTKCEALVKGVLGPYSVQCVTEKLKQHVFFGLGFDASNKGNIKCFPIAVRYFDEKIGVCNRIIDFYDDADETALKMSEQICSRISKLGLLVCNVSSFSADNTNSNFGKKNSVYVHLKKQNPTLVKANCCAHVVHNSCKAGMNTLSLDIEMLIIKIFNYFSNSAKRVSHLKEFFDFVDLEYTNLLRHVPTRWLSLKPAIDRLLRNLPAVYSYFSSVDDCPAFIKKYFVGPSDSERQKILVELYLHFSLLLTEIFHKAVLSLEKNTLTICELYSVMKRLKMQLEQRMEQSFFGYKVSQMLNLLKELFPGEVRACEDDFKHAYEVCINYLCKWFDFSDSNVLALTDCLNLETSPQFTKILQLVESLGLVDKLNVDDMYSEVIEIVNLFSGEAVEQIKVTLQNKTIPERWVYIAGVIGPEKMSNILLLLKFLLSIFPSNAYTERVFSIMAIKWRDERNRSCVDLIKNELFVYFNYDENCKEFHQTVLLNKKLLTIAASNNKYLCP